MSPGPRKAAAARMNRRTTAIARPRRRKLGFAAARPHRLDRRHGRGPRSRQPGGDQTRRESRPDAARHQQRVERDRSAFHRDEHISQRTEQGTERQRRDPKADWHSDRRADRAQDQRSPRISARSWQRVLPSDRNRPIVLRRSATLTPKMLATEKSARNSAPDPAEGGTPCAVHPAIRARGRSVSPATSPLPRRRLTRAIRSRATRAPRRVRSPRRSG